MNGHTSPLSVSLHITPFAKSDVRTSRDDRRVSVHLNEFELFGTPADVERWLTRALADVRRVSRVG